jgi:hypothetical protein
MENRYDATVSQVEGFIREVGSILNEDNQPIKEEKALLVNSAKHFKEIIERPNNQF